MKKNELDIINSALKFKWRIETLQPKKKSRRKKSSQCDFYMIGDSFRLVSNSTGEISGISLCKPRKKPVPLSCFMGIKPTYYRCSNGLNIVFLIGNEPCNTHYLIFCLEHFDANGASSSVQIKPIYEKCKCDEESPNQTVLYSVAGVIPH